MRVFLDDERTAPDGWTQVRWPDEAIELLERGGVTHVSLDHDLGDDERGTGYDVVLWLEEAVMRRGFEPPIVTVHSANTSARQKMEAGIQAIERFVEKQRPSEPPDPNAIDIGDSGVLTGVVATDPTQPSTSIDALLEPTLRFWELAEFCDPMCCGIQAYDLRDAQIYWWSMESEHQHLDRDFQRLHDGVSAMESPVVESKKLNQRFLREGFLRMIEHIQTNLPEDLTDPGWFAVAKARFSELEIDWGFTRANGPYELWSRLKEEFKSAYDREDSELIRRIYDLAEWFCKQDDDNLATAVCVCFYEHIPEHPKALQDMPNWWTREQVVAMKSLFTYQVGDVGYAKILAQFAEPES